MNFLLFNVLFKKSNRFKNNTRTYFSVNHENRECVNFSSFFREKIRSLYTTLQIDHTINDWN